MELKEYLRGCCNARRENLGDQVDSFIILLRYTGVMRDLEAKKDIYILPSKGETLEPIPLERFLKIPLEDVPMYLERYEPVGCDILKWKLLYELNS